LGAHRHERQALPRSRVARWFVFKPKIQIWVNFGRSCNGRCCFILWTLGPFYCLLLYFMDIWRSILVYFSPSWYFVPRKIWQLCLGASTCNLSNSFYLCRMSWGEVVVAYVRDLYHRDLSTKKKACLQKT
jgi:hypothetical protein